MESTEETTPKLWSVVYQHRHGEDTWIYSSEANAYIGACCIIMEWIAEVDNDEDRIEMKRLFLDGEYEEMISLWSEYQCERGDENIAIGLAGEVDGNLKDLEKFRTKAAEPDESNDKKGD